MRREGLCRGALAVFLVLALGASKGGAIAPSNKVPSAHTTPHQPSPMALDPAPVDLLLAAILKETSWRLSQTSARTRLSGRGKKLSLTRFSPEIPVLDQYALDATLRSAPPAKKDCLPSIASLQSLSIQKLHAVTQEFDLAVSGRAHTTSAGFIEADLVVEGWGFEDILTRLARSGVIPQDTALLLTASLQGMALLKNLRGAFAEKSKRTGSRPHHRFHVVCKKGRIWVNDLAVGFLRPVRWSGQDDTKKPSPRSRPLKVVP